MSKDSRYTVETCISGCLIKPYAAIRLVPITRENIYTLKPGDWIWDDKLIERREHERSLRPETITEPIGFRQIHILDLDDFHRWNSKPFMLSTIDDSYANSYTWVYFEENRFYMCATKE